MSSSLGGEKVVENFSSSMDSESVLDNHSTSKDKGRILEGPLTVNGEMTCLEQPLVSKCSENVLQSRDLMENSKDMFIRCVNNQQDNTFHVEASTGEQSAELDKSEDVDVEIMDCGNSGATGLFEAANHDTSESSFSDTENGSSLVDFEVNSHFFEDNTSALAFGECVDERPLRKKKLTDHWRSFIHHIRWRCRWIEVQRRELNFQVSQYERELAKYDQRKQYKLENHTLEDVGAKSLPFWGHAQRKNVMKRKKRKRVEDTIDLKSYMSRHSLLSYFENRKSFADGTHKDNIYCKPVISTDLSKNTKDEFGVNNEELTLPFREDDDSLERILWKIDSIQSQVQKLRQRGDNLVIKIPQKFSSLNKLSLPVPCDALASSQVGTSCENSEGILINDPASTPPRRSTVKPVTTAKASVSTSKRTSGRRKPCPSNWSKRSSELNEHAWQGKK